MRRAPGVDARGLMGQREESSVRLNFHGAAQTVTGSQHLLEINGKHLLLECGLYQGRREESYRRNREFRYDPRSVDAVILSHAHIDHSGNLPNLVRQGFAGPIYATSATADLSDIMLRDSGHIQEADADFVNKRLRPGEAPVRPIYTQADAEQVAGFFHSVEYTRSFEAIPGVERDALRRGAHPWVGWRATGDPGWRTPAAFLVFGRHRPLQIAASAGSGHATACGLPADGMHVRGSGS